MSHEAIGTPASDTNQPEPGPERYKTRFPFTLELSDGRILRFETKAERDAAVAEINNADSN